MEINIVEETKSKLLFEIDEGHAFCNALKDELAQDSHVKVASYRRDHPLIKVVRFMVETDGKATPKDSIKKAVSRLTTKNKNLKSQFQKVLK